MIAPIHLPTLLAEVDRGAKLLDEKVPGWAENIPTDERLHMDSCGQCVLGHLYGLYRHGLVALELVTGVSHGFDLRRLQGSDHNFDLLADAWRAEIRKRLTKAPTG